MNLQAKTVSIGWISLATVVPGAYVTYFLYDLYNPTGNTWLNENGYSFRRLIFADHGNQSHGCADNLFGIDKDDEVSDPKLYGCTVMKIDVYNTGHEFTAPNIDPKYINFSSETALRKENKGWVINTRIDNYSSNEKTHFNYLLSEYMYEGSRWTKKRTFSIWPNLSNSSPDASKNEFQIKSESDKGDSKKVETYKRQLNITFPKGKLLDSYLIKADANNQTTGQKKFLRSRQYIGFWVPDESKPKEEWIFKDIDIWPRQENKSIFFCKVGDEEKCPYQSLSYYEGKEVLRSYNSWQEIINDKTNSIKEVRPSWIMPMIDAIKNEKGKWVGIGDICSFRWVRNLNEEQKKHLKMFCAVDRT